MARSALRWDAAELAKRAGVGRMTVLNFEAEQGKPRRATLEVISRALEAAGIEFLPGDAVRLHDQRAAS